MKRTLFTVIILTLASVCLASEANAQKFSKVVTDSNRWAPITIASEQDCTGDPQECALEVLGDLNISVGDEPDFSVYRIGETEGATITVVFVSHLVEDDDSVLGELYRLELSQSDADSNSYHLEELGKMYQCMRGPIGWRKTVCP